MKPDINLNLISKAIADVLMEQFPESTIYDSPNQQSTLLPAWFINYMPGSSIEKQIGDRFMRTLRVDLVYLEDFNLTDLYDRYRAAADILDETIETFAYTSSSGEKYMVHAHDRKWKMDLSALHYELTVKIRVSSIRPTMPKMATIDALSQTAY